jgi:hypothetical protein
LTTSSTHEDEALRAALSLEDGKLIITEPLPLLEPGLLVTLQAFGAT